MQFEEIVEHARDVPYIRPAKGKIIYDFVRKTKPDKCLELGFYHGSSSCYIAAALQENGSGHLTSIDRISALEITPSITDMVQKTGLNEYITPIFAKKSYNWELMKIIENNSFQYGLEPIYDFCFIDGAHSWETDGFAFLLCAKLLKPGGWVLFDDLAYRFQDTYAKQETNIDDYLAEMTDEERNTPQIEKVFSLLVSQHPSFENAFIDGSWGWARKIDDDSDVPNTDYNKFIKEIYAKTRLWRFGATMRLYMNKAMKVMKSG